MTTYLQQPSLMKLDLYNYVIKGLSGAGIMLLYDKVYENSSWDLSIYDSAAFAGSIVTVNAIKDLLLN